MDSYTRQLLRRKLPIFIMTALVLLIGWTAKLFVT